MRWGGWGGVGWKQGIGSTFLPFHSNPPEQDSKQRKGTKEMKVSTVQRRLSLQHQPPSPAYSGSQDTRVLLSQPAFPKGQWLLPFASTGARQRLVCANLRAKRWKQRQKQLLPWPTSLSVTSDRPFVHKTEQAEDILTGGKGSRLSWVCLQGMKHTSCPTTRDHLATTRTRSLFFSLKGQEQEPNCTKLSQSHLSEVGKHVWTSFTHFSEEDNRSVQDTCVKEHMNPHFMWQLQHNVMERCCF